MTVSLTNDARLRKILIELKLLPENIPNQSDLKIANFRFVGYRTLVLKPAAPGYRKWLTVNSLEWVEVEYHLNKLIKELGVSYEK